MSADALYSLIGDGFARVPDLRRPGSTIPLRGALMSAFAMFSLKDPSLLAFDERRDDGNLKRLYGIGRIPSDTQMREILDQVDPEHLRGAFGDVFRQLQRGKALEPFEFYKGAYLLSLDLRGARACVVVRRDLKETGDARQTGHFQQIVHRFRLRSRERNSNRSSGIFSVLKVSFSILQRARPPRANNHALRRLTPLGRNQPYRKNTYRLAAE